MRRRLRFVLLSGAGLTALLLAAAGCFVYWFQFGPGFEQEVDRLAALLEVRPGMTLAEIGAGKGRMAVLVARRIGSSGRLYATEIEDGKLEAIRSAAAGLTNVTVIHAGADSSGLPEACCDAVYMRRVYHHFTDAEAMNKSTYSSLRPSGRLVIIDFLSPRWLFFLRHGIPADEVARQLRSAGFTLERRLDGWSPIDYCLVFRRPLGATSQ